jgi:hypothetical protein
VARNPHKQGGLATPPPELDDDDAPDESPADVDEDDQGAGDDPADESRPARKLPRVQAPGRAVSVASDGAGWVLGLLLWAGVGLPFLKGGPTQVKAWWMAKFLNKAPDGSWLP